MKIITLGREFGSGGRELGKRLADQLGIAYYDREIVTELARRTSYDEDYISNALLRNTVSNIPIHFGHTISYAPQSINATGSIYIEQHKLIRELAQKGNCVIVGRAASVILEDFKPFRLFVHADMESRVRRCQERAEAGENLSDKEMERHIRRIDAERKRYFDFFSDIPWGDRRCYELCVNTTGREIKELVPSVAEYIKAWYND